MGYKNILIKGSGKCIPKEAISGDYFKEHSFYLPNGEPVEVAGNEAAKKLQGITGIVERKYADADVVTSDLAAIAAKKAISDAEIDQESIDLIIVGHNFGDVKAGSSQTDMLPSIATRVKHQLGIENPNCVAFDVIFGCPGWVQGVLQAYAYMKAGMANSALIIGADTLSRVVDDHDRDSMIYADGAGAVVLQQTEEESQRGILSVGSKTYAKDEAFFLYYGETFHPEKEDENLYIKMHGRKIYEFALTHVPKAMNEVLESESLDIKDLKKIFIHQANEKMDEAILNRFYRAHKIPVPDGVMPMNIQEFGNSSVATIPTLYDMVRKGELSGHQINPGDLLLFASVGAGMNINAFAYKS